MWARQQTPRSSSFPTSLAAPTCALEYRHAASHWSSLPKRRDTLGKQSEGEHRSNVRPRRFPSQLSLSLPLFYTLLHVRTSLLPALYSSHTTAPREAQSCGGKAATQGHALSQAAACADTCRAMHSNVPHSFLLPLALPPLFSTKRGCSYAAHQRAHCTRRSGHINARHNAQSDGRQSDMWL